jgi:pyruvate dehydrogenase E1 component alpha subunit
MHLVDRSVNFLGCVPIVGSTIPIGVGAAFGATMQGRAIVSVVFFGDGAAETGLFHESINFAATHKLPVLFVCENNLYSVNTPMQPRQPLNRTIADLARGHGIEAVRQDGQGVELVHEVALDALTRVRGGQAPMLLEFATYRWAEHCGPLGDLHLGYRSQQEFDSWFARCPVALQRGALRTAGLLSAQDEAIMHAEIDRDIDAAVTFARQSPFPERAELGRGVYPS